MRNMFPQCCLEIAHRRVAVLRVGSHGLQGDPGQGGFFFDSFDLISRRLVDVKPLLTDILPLSRAVEAFELAGDRSKAMKVHIAMQDG